MQTNDQKENIQFFIDGKALISKELSKNNSLSSIRNDLTKQFNIDVLFMLNDGFIIEKQEENSFSLNDIYDGNEVYLKSKINNSFINNQTKEKETAKENYKKEDINSKIVERLKEEINMAKNNLNSQSLDKPPATTPIITDIKNTEEKTPIINDNNQSDNSLNVINVDKKLTPKESLNFEMNKTEKIKVFIDQDYRFDCEMNKNWNLPKVREKLSSLIKDDFVFLLPDRFAIDHLEEEIFSLEGILNGDKIQIHQKQLMPEMNIPNNNIITSDTSIKKNIKNNCDNNIIYNKKELQKETKLMNNIDNKNKNDIEKSNNNNKQLKNLIQECKKLDNIGNLEIYLYPNYKFSSSEIKNSINFMVVGQTGSGKTTLLNAFLNYLLGVKFEDNFRFKLIHEDFGISMAESQTKDVIIYNIKSFNKNIPPIRVIDTPGFGDTGGIDKDRLISDKIAEKFKTEVSHINAICFVAQSTNSKLTVNQKYIFNSIMDLFSEDIRENFIAMLTFCNIIDENPVILEPLKKKDQDLI